MVTIRWIYAAYFCRFKFYFGVSNIQDICTIYNSSLDETVWPRLVERRLFKFFVPARPSLDFGQNEMMNTNDSADLRIRNLIEWSIRIMGRILLLLFCLKLTSHLYTTSNNSSKQLNWFRHWFLLNSKLLGGVMYPPPPSDDRIITRTTVVVAIL